VERNGAPSGSGDSPRRDAGDARPRRRRTRSRKKKRSAWVTKVLENLGWVIVAIVLGVPVLAGLLYLAGL